MSCFYFTSMCTSNIVNDLRHHRKGVPLSTRIKQKFKVQGKYGLYKN